MAWFSTAPKTKDTIQSLWKLEKIILDTLDFREVVQKICDSVLTELGYLNLGYRIIVLTLIDEEKGVLKRISLSQTSEAEEAQKASAVPFHEIEIPLNAESNLLIRALKDGKPYVTHHWPDIFRPILTDEQALKNQTAAGIKTSMIYPVIIKDKPSGVLIFSMIKGEEEVFENELDLIKGYTDVVGLAVQNAKLYTNLEETEKQLELANMRLKEVDALKDEFVSLASHELRTPMTIIKSYVFMLLNGAIGELNERQKTYLERTLSSTERLINLVNDMLNVSRIESGKLTIEKTQTDLGKLIFDVVNEMQTKAREAGINLIYNQPESPLTANIDINRIKEVIINLIGNSLKFTPKDGSITVTLDRQENDSALMKVADTGRGISAQDMEKLFKKFNMVGHGHLTKDKGQGTGLGLYLSKSLVELHGGKIWAQSPGEGKGSTFSIILPLNNNGVSKTTEQPADLSDQTNTNLSPSPNQRA
ncbi:MAG: GAF domain-containing sensor histidine kinase [Candidatus Levybacteria bacterium]|nr:GAF domain-containing sensor histidine kinase [Candidatus Levybacteria bacterium]